MTHRAACLALFLAATPARAHSPNAEQSSQLARFEDASLWIHEGDTATPEFETGGEVSGIEHATTHSSEPLNVIECSLTDLGVYV